MAVIPRYWYVETVEGGTGFEVLPADVVAVGPDPLAERTVVVDKATGEIYGEAVLMCALPSPRFRDLFTGKEVILPRGMAETLERAEEYCSAVKPKSDLSHSRDKVSELSLTCWVQVQGVKVLAFHVRSYLELDYRRAIASMRAK